MTRLASLVLAGLLGGPASPDDRRDAELADMVTNFQLPSLADSDELKWRKLIAIQRDIEHCDIITKMLMTFPKNFRNPTAKFVETLARRAVLTETYVEFWIFNTTHLNDAYEQSRPKQSRDGHRGHR